MFLGGVFRSLLLCCNAKGEEESMSVHPIKKKKKEKRKIKTQITPAPSSETHLEVLFDGGELPVDLL